VEDLQKMVAMRLKHARETNKLSQERAAQLLAVDRARLSGMENGTRPVDIVMLAKLAEVYGVSTSYFMGRDQPVAKPVAVMLRSVLEHEDTAIQAELSPVFRFVERFVKLQDQLAEPFPKRDIPRWNEVANPPKSRLEGYVEHLKKRWGLDDVPVAPRIFALLEDQGIPVYRYPLADDRISGAYWEVPEMGPLIFVNARDVPYRQAFTAAHELAHVLFHHDASVSYKRPTNALTIEKFANEFASILLMPAADIEAYIVGAGIGQPLEADDVVMLHRHFGVSYAAMLVRLKKLRLIQETQYQAFKQERPVSLALELGYAVQSWEFGYNPDEVSTTTRLRWLPRHYVKLVRRASDDHLLTDKQAAKYLNLDYEAWADLLLNEQAAQQQSEDFEDAEAIVS
jgi:Zn-dependent peptidase ImmA (M78 family)